jgi:hypothetical protein
MEVEHHILDRGRSELAEDAMHERLTGHRQCRLGPNE